MHAPGQERTKTLTSGALAVDDDASLWKPLLCLDAETRSITINNTGHKQGFPPWMAKYCPVLHTGMTLTCTAQGLDKSNACTGWWTDIHIQDCHSTYKNMKKGWILQSLKSMLNQLVIIQLYTITVTQHGDHCNWKPEQEDYALVFSCRKSQRCFTVTATVPVRHSKSRRSPLTWRCSWTAWPQRSYPGCSPPCQSPPACSAPPPPRAPSQSVRCPGKTNTEVNNNL